MQGRRRLSLVLATALVCWPLGAVAQREVVEREVDVPGEHPVAAYGAADVPLMLVFDSALRVSDGGVLPMLASGVDSRVHPFDRHALIVTASSDAGGTVRLRIPLEDWIAEVNLDLTKGKVDQVVKVLRRGRTADGGVQVSPKELGHLYRAVAGLVLRGGGCKAAELGEEIQLENIEQRQNQGRVVVCAFDLFTVVRVERRHPACAATWARVLHQGGALTVRYVSGQAAGPEGKEYQTLVVLTPVEAAEDYELELLATDGTVCEHYYELKLQPGDSL